MKEIILTLDSVVKNYYTKKRSPLAVNNAVDGVTLAVEKGEIFGLLGSNGAGKSTILKMICGLISATSGEIKLNGERIGIDTYRQRAAIGALIEMPFFLENYSGMYNLQYLAALSGNITQKRIDNMVELMDMQEYINNPVRTYSLGMRQKLGIAQAIMSKPQLLILDEPTNGLDPQWIKEVRELLKVFKEEYGMTIIVSSHVLAEMQEICDRVAILSKGKVIECGSINDMAQALDNGKNIVEISVDDVAKAIKLLDIRQAQYSVNGNVLLVKALREEVPQLTKELVLDGIMINGINIKEMKLEDIYASVIQNARGNSKDILLNTDNTNVVKIANADSTNTNTAIDNNIGDVVGISADAANDTIADSTASDVVKDITTQEDNNKTQSQDVAKGGEDE